MAVTARGGAEQIRGMIFHTDRGSTYTANEFTTLCRRFQITQSMGRVGSCFDNNAVAEAFFSSLEWEVLSRHAFATTGQAQAVVIDWCYGLYNVRRLHGSLGNVPPVEHEQAHYTALNQEPQPA